MAMPKKGRRQVIIGNEIYYYMVKKAYEHEYYGNKKASVTIEAPDGRIYKGREQLDAVTPSYVEKLIRRHLL